MATEKLANWWNARADGITERIKDGVDPKDTTFRWSVLVWQELEMWESMGRQVNTEDLGFIVSRREFTPFQKDFLIEGLKHLGLWRPNGPGELGGEAPT